jgi:hypothetical protein
MKALLVAAFLLAASAAFGQSGSGASVLNNQPIILTLPSHPEHAAYLPMGQEQNLRERSAFTFGKGEQPLWQFAPVTNEEPLGDIARAFREEHAKAKKADFIRTN